MKMERINTQYHQTAPQIQEEFEMIKRAKNDSRRFEPLYNKYHEQIFRYVHNRVNDQQVASDIVSQVFMKAISNIGSYQFKGVPFGSWLYRIASSELNQWFRRSSATRKVSVPFERLRNELIETTDEKNDELLDLLTQSLNQMKEDDLELIELRYFEMRSVREISEMKDWSESNVKVKCHRAMNKLKKIFSELNASL